MGVARHEIVANGEEHLVLWNSQGCKHGHFQDRRIFAVTRAQRQRLRKGHVDHFTRGRIERLGDGREIVWSVQQMLDEIDDADIVRLSDGARAVAERAIARRSDIALAQWERDHATIGYLPTWARKLPRSMTVLRTPAELVAEGRDLHHCVGGYVEAVRRGQCVILAVRSRHGRSTVEMSTDGLTVRQHYGAYNGAPPARHAALLRAWHLRITTTTEYRRSA